MKKTIVLILSFIVIYSCSNKNKNSMKISSSLFNIENLKKTKVSSFTDKNLNNQGYNRVVTDMLIYKKEIKDTIVLLGIDNKYDNIRTKTWKVRLTHYDQNYVKNYIQSYGVISMAGYELLDKVDNTFSFPAIRIEDNSLFICHTSKENENYYLNIKYYVPIDKSMKTRSR